MEPTSRNPPEKADKGVTQLSPITEKSQEGSQGGSEISMTESTVIMKFMTIMEKMERRLDEDTMERRRDRQEREALYSMGQGGSSKSTTVAGQRIGKAPIFTPPDKPISLGSPYAPERPHKQLFQEKGDNFGEETEEPSPERLERAVSDQFVRRLELPEFDGSEVENWLARVEQYFEVSYCSEEQKAAAVRSCFTGDALDWYLWEGKRDPFFSWAHMKQRILAHFSKYRHESAGERLVHLRQVGSVDDFCREFIGIATNVPTLQEEMLELAFMAGLSPWISTRVKTFEPQNLQRMMFLARKVDSWEEGAETPPESRVKTERGGTSRGPQMSLSYRMQAGPNNGRPNANVNTPRPATSFQHNNTNGVRNPSSHLRVKAPFRRLTPAEVAYRKANKLCFRCDDPGHLSQNCPHKELQLLIVEDDGREHEWDGVAEVDYGEEVREECGVAALSLNSMAGISSPRTLKIRGYIHTTPVVVMVDSGATHNFVSERVVQQLDLPTDATSSYGVVTGTGLTVQGRGICKGIELSLQGFTIVTNFLPLELGSADVILGIQWLEELGDMTCN